MDFKLLEAEKFSRLESMFITAIQKVEDLAQENFILKSRYLTTEDVAKLTGYDSRTITLKKDEIGYISQGHKIKFKQADVTAWMEKYYIRPRK